jgi:hypothetical protein
MAPHTDQLNRPAALLDAVGRTASDTRVAIRCLLASESLHRAGARRRTIPGPVPDARTTIAAALKSLGALDDSTLDDDHVIGAMHHALLAHAATN